MLEKYRKAQVLIISATIIIGASYGGFAWLFSIFGQETIGRILGAIIGVIVWLKLLKHSHDAEIKRLKERRALEQQYREAGLITDED